MIDKKEKRAYTLCNVEYNVPSNIKPLLRGAIDRFNMRTEKSLNTNIFKGGK